MFQPAAGFRPDVTDELSRLLTERILVIDGAMGTAIQRDRPSEETYRGARFADWGLAITRTDPAVPKHNGLTAFLVPLRAPGVDIRPIRQMSGGSSFNEVFLAGVRLPDELRLGAVGDGWRVALTCLGFERDHSGGGGGGHVGGRFEQVLALAHHLERTDDPLVRQSLADVYIHLRVAQLTNRRAATRLRAGQTPGPEASLGKLMWTAA